MTAPQPPSATIAKLALDSGVVLTGRGFGACGLKVGELCFNTGMTGYQETLSDPSFAGQIITFTSPHIGNVGCNPEDMEGAKPRALGLIARQWPTAPSNSRATENLNDWLCRHELIGLVEVDTRALTLLIRDGGAPKAALWHGVAADSPDDTALVAMAQAWCGLEGMDLASQVSTTSAYDWTQGLWAPSTLLAKPTDAAGSANAASPTIGAAKPTVVVIDFGVKSNILRHLVAQGCRVRVLPASASLDQVMAESPAGVLLSNGPGDPAATGLQVVPLIKALLQRRIPIMAICLGHQLLALALGGSTYKLPLGHRGANHPVLLADHRVAITSQNHGFAVADGQQNGLQITQRSLFDRTVEGFTHPDYPIISVQYHPEASPGPLEGGALFAEFYQLMQSVASQDSAADAIAKTA
ncbi:MAG: glutamine-hydrolyzing carbamoyl-phosphate synthase small subunit [Alphaproteobacteria bacterium]|nr:glutamine-hydrolyzing carbamoyl-phosphate synthase small subunit [Alphaproteobacteria bacterium]